MTHLAVIDDVPFDEAELNRLAAALGGTENIRLAGRVGPATTVESVLRRVANAEIVMSSWTDFPASVIQELHTVRLISMVATNIGGVDVQAATRARIAVTNVPEYAKYSVSELALGLLLNLVRRIHLYDQRSRAGNFDRETSPGTELRGLTIGVIGMGAIGSRMAVIAGALGMKVISTTKHPSAEKAKALGVRFVPLDVLLSDSDVITIHAPLDESTRGMIGKREFSLMKRSALLIYTSRPGICNETDLIVALKSGQIAGLGVDECSPLLMGAGSPLRTLTNVVVTPTIGFYTTQAIRELHSGAIENVIGFLNGKPMNVVNPEVLSAPR